MAAGHCPDCNEWDGETIVRLIACTTTVNGLRATCRLDRRRYPAGRRVSNDDFATVNLQPDSFHGEWNHGTHPRDNQLL